MTVLFWALGVIYAIASLLTALDRSPKNGATVFALIVTSVTATLLIYTAIVLL